MIFDSLRDRMGEDEPITPLGIARNGLFTAKEKLDLLNQLKADALAAGEEGHAASFDPEEIDKAIAQVRQGVQDGINGETIIKGEF